MSSPLSNSDLQDLQRAVTLLERSSFAGRLANLADAPISIIGRAIPAGASRSIATVTSKALSAAMHAALLTLGKRPKKRSPALHRVLAMASGAVGGAFGFAALPVELPVSTVIMLRSIADIARQQGEELHQPDAALACLQVFALGGRSEEDDAAKSSYFAVRGILAQSLAEAARFVAERGIVEESAPLLVRLTALIASRFGIVVSQKVAAQAIPVIGALGGAAINYAFVSHFQDVAQGHFSVRRLERAYGKEIVQGEYQRIMRDSAAG